MVTPYKVDAQTCGGAVRTRSIAAELANLGHEVTLLSADEKATGPSVRPTVHQHSFAHRGRVAHFFNRSFQREFAIAIDRKPALIVAELPYQSLMIVPAARRRGIPIVYNSQNVEAVRFRSMGQRAAGKIVELAERYLCRHAAAILAVSEEDRQLFRHCYRRDALLLPNGVDTQRFAPGKPNPDLLSKLGLTGKQVVLYFGSYDYAPNIEALQFLVTRWPEVVASRPDARLLVVGRCPPHWARQANVIVTGPVDDIVEHIRLAHVVAVPLSSGGGTRLKILEALACGQTVLSTPFGAMGLPQGEQTGIVRAGLSHFVPRLCELIQSQPPCANPLARQTAGRFDWAKLVRAVPWNSFVAQGQRRESQLPTGHDEHCEADAVYS